MSETQIQFAKPAKSVKSVKSVTRFFESDRCKKYFSSEKHLFLTAKPYIYLHCTFCVRNATDDEINAYEAMIGPGADATEKVGLDTYWCPSSKYKNVVNIFKRQGQMDLFNGVCGKLAHIAIIYKASPYVPNAQTNSSELNIPGILYCHQSMDKDVSLIENYEESKESEESEESEE